MMTCPEWCTRGLRVMKYLAALAFIVAGMATPGYGAESRGFFCDREAACEFQFYIENDIISGTDRYYTNGIKLGGGLNPGPLIERIFQRPAEQVLRRFSDNPDGVSVGLFLGQNIYTPKDITIAAPQPFDRPWAAWLYLGGVAQSVSGDRLQTVELDIGVIGPAALGKEVQTAVHEAIDSDHPRGWHNQLRNEPGLMLTYMEKWRFGPQTGVQLVPHFGASMGNVMTLARAGFTVRTGQNMTGFGPDTIEPGGAMLQRVRLNDPKSQQPRREWYLFGGADFRAVAHNIFVDGSLFRSGPSVDSREFVYDFKAGFSVRYRPVRFSFTNIWRSEEFRTPVGGGGNQIFQSVNISVEF
jgi:lipid A 3-O-deacylase